MLDIYWQRRFMCSYIIIIINISLKNIISFSQLYWRNVIRNLIMSINLKLISTIFLIRNNDLNDVLLSRLISFAHSLVYSRTYARACDRSRLVLFLVTLIALENRRFLKTTTTSFFFLLFLVLDQNRLSLRHVILRRRDFFDRFIFVVLFDWNKISIIK